MIILLTAPGIKLMGGDQIGQKTESRYELVEEVFGERDFRLRGGEKKEKGEKRRKGEPSEGTRKKKAP